MSPDCSKSNVSDGSRPLRSDPGLTISATHRSPHSSSTVVGWHLVGPIGSSLVPGYSGRPGPPSGPGPQVVSPPIRLGSCSTRRLPCQSRSPKVRIDWSTSSRTSGSPTPVGPSNTGGRRWTGQGRSADQLEQMELRGISASKSLGGMIRVDGWMTTTAGLAFLAAHRRTHATPTPRRHADSPAASSRRPRRPGPPLPRSRRHPDRGRREAPHQSGVRSACPPRHRRWAPRDRERAISSPSWSSEPSPATARSAGSCSALTARSSMSAGAPESSPRP